MQSLTSFDLDPGVLETAGCGVTSRSRGVETLAGCVGPVSEGRVGLGRRFTPPECLLETLPGELQACPRGAPFLVGKAAAQLGEALAHGPELDGGHRLLAQLSEPGGR